MDLYSAYTGGMPVLVLISDMCNSRAYLRCSRPLYISLMGSSTEKVVRKHIGVFSILLCACKHKHFVKV